MSNTSDSDELSIPYPAIPKAPSENVFAEFFTYLAFEGHALRVGLELGLCVLLFAVLEKISLWSRLSNESWNSLGAWFTACTLVVFIDQFVLCRAVYIFRNAYQLSLAGAYDKALSLLESIAPERHMLVRCPRTLFHLLRAEILTQSETFRSAECEIELAEQAGAKGEQIRIARSRLYRTQASEDGKTDIGFQKAREELEAARKEFGETPIICLEEGLLLLEEHKDLWAAKKALKRVCDMQEEIHFSGDSTSQLARAGLEAARLWTGEAEEGLDGLTLAIDRLRSMAMYIDTLRPLLALLYLERAFYLATHKEPEQACFDLRLGLSLCNYPNLRKRAAMVKEELAWRHKVHLPV